jgi:hypothetical protein
LAPQRRMFGLQFADFVGQQHAEYGWTVPSTRRDKALAKRRTRPIPLPNPHEIAEHVQALRGKPGHSASQRALLSHIMSLRLVGSLLSKEPSNVAAAAIEHEFRRHLPTKTLEIIGDPRAKGLLLPKFQGIEPNRKGVIEANVVHMGALYIAAEFHPRSVTHSLRSCRPSRPHPHYSFCLDCGQDVSKFRLAARC